MARCGDGIYLCGRTPVARGHAGCRARGMNRQEQQEQLDAYVALADDLAAAMRMFLDGSIATLRARGFRFKRRDRIIVALCFKIESAFRALIDDARLRRAEATHHLKTMLEAFFYMLAAAKDLTDVTALRVLAEVYARKADYFRLNPDRDTPAAEYRSGWEASLNDLATAGIIPIGAAWNAASSHSPELRKWYDAAYRYASEPAHIADLLDFMPPQDLADFDLGRLTSGPLHSQIAIDHALIVMLHTMRLVSDNDERVAMDLAPFEDRLRDLDARRREET